MQSNNSNFNLTEESLGLILAPLVEMQPQFIGGSSDSIIIADFIDFKGECIKHQTHIPFFEIVSLNSSSYEHLIDDKPLSSSSNRSGISFYTSQIGYSIRCPESTDCTLLTINPELFKQCLINYDLPESFFVHKRNIDDNYIRMMIERIGELINRSILRRLEPFDKLSIDSQSRVLLEYLLDQYFNPKRKNKNYSITIKKGILEWINSKIEDNEEIRLEELLIEFSIENSISFLRSFESSTGKDFYDFCMERRVELLGKIKFSISSSSKKLSPKDLKKALEIIHEKIKSLRNASLDKERIVREDEETIVKEIAKELGYDSKHFISAFKGSMGIPPEEYYQQQRMELVKHLLLMTDDSTENIARQVGYNGSKPADSLRKVFTHYFGISPRAFRRDYKKRIIP